MTWGESVVEKGEKEEKGEKALEKTGRGMTEGGGVVLWTREGRDQRRDDDD